MTQVGMRAALLHKRGMMMVIVACERCLKMHLKTPEHVGQNISIFVKKELKMLRHKDVGTKMQLN